MIVDPLSSRTSMAKYNEHDEHVLAEAQQAPPSYDAVVNGGFIPPNHPGHGHFSPESASKAQDVKVPTLPNPPSYPYAPARPSTSQNPTTPVYHYVDAATGECIVSFRPPDHPQMVCLQRGHETTSKFGFLGVLAAILWFPLGIGLCLLDRKVFCKRCGAVLDEGMC